MSRIEIDAGGRRVTVDHDGELAHLAKTAQELWDHTEGPAPSPGPAMGFSGDRTWQPRPASHMHRDPGPATAQAEADHG